MKSLFRMICTLGMLLSLLLGAPLQGTDAPQVEQPRQYLMSLLTGSIIARTLYSLAELQVADHMTTTAQHVNALAAASSAEPQALYRALRLAASYGIFVEGPAEHFALNELGALLQQNNAQSLYGVALHEDEARWQALGNLTHCLQTGQQAFSFTHGVPYFEYLAQNTKAAAQFDTSMAAISRQENYALARACDFSNYTSIMDVGGGYGGFLAEIMRVQPQVQTILYDLPQVVRQHEPMLVQPSARCTVLAGSFFEHVPAGYEVYLMKRILHDWDDEQALKVLHNCKQALGASGRLLVLDAVVAAGNERDIIKDIDVLLLALFGGVERTEAEFRQLFKHAGLRVVALHKTPTLLSIFELAAE